MTKLGPPTGDGPRPGEPPLAPPERKEAELAAPIDIPGFALVRPGIATGQQPFPDGVDWLQKRGYRTVLHLRDPQSTDTAAQRVFEARKLRYVAITVAPKAITREAVDAFNRLVGDESARPLFVFDGEGIGNSGGLLAPGMWYLHFRTAGGLSQEEALTEAKRLGFRPDFDPAHREFLQAANAYLQNPM